MSVRIVDNKKLEMTDHEWKLYQHICKSYDEVNFKGSDLFVGLFETDDNGIIMFLRPPSTRATTLEAYLFLVTLMTHQHLRISHSQVDDLVAQVKNKLKEYDAKIEQLEKKLKE